MHREARGASPEPLFRAIVAKRTALRGKFPRQFDENYMTGVFIPAARIGAARAWMEHHLAKLTPGERELVAPIERVLAAAEKHGRASTEGRRRNVEDR